MLGCVYLSHKDQDDMSETMPSPLAQAELTTELVSAYVSRNAVPVGELPGLIRSIHQSLVGLGTPAAPEAAAEPLKPAVPVKKSITEDYIISLEDGRKLKSMKRYLAGLGMTPAEYRAKWGLPADYPMVAPAYAKQRSELAKPLGLGRKAEPQPAAAPAAEAEPEPEAPAPKRGRRKAADAAAD